MLKADDVAKKLGYNVHLAAEARDVTELKKMLDKKGSDEALKAFDGGGRTPLMIALDNADVASSLVLLKVTGDVNVRNFHTGETALHYAAKRGLRLPMSSLLAKGANVYIQDNEGRIPLFYLVPSCEIYIGKQSPLVCRQILLTAMEDPQLKNKDSIASQLHQAVQKGDDRKLFLLLEKKPNLECRNKHGATPLIVAAKRGHLMCMTMLLDRRADVSVYDGSGRRAADYIRGSALAGRISKEVTMALGLSTLEGSTVEVKKKREFQDHFEKRELEYHKRSDLYLAIQFDNKQQAILFDNQPIDTNCAIFGRVESVLLDIQDPDTRDPKSLTSQLYDAILERQPCTSAMVPSLLEKGADANSRNREGFTPLMCAVGQRSEKSLTSLLDFNAEPNEIDKHGQTALHWAASSVSAALINPLLQAGACSRIKDKKGHSALITALEFGRYEAAGEIIKAESLLKRKGIFIDALEWIKQKLSTDPHNRPLNDFNELIEKIVNAIDTGTIPLLEDGNANANSAGNGNHNADANGNANGYGNGNENGSVEKTKNLRRWN